MDAVEGGSLGYLAIGDNTLSLRAAFSMSRCISRKLRGTTVVCHTKILACYQTGLFVCGQVAASGR
jgi:hypothetical protein